MLFKTALRQGVLFKAALRQGVLFKTVCTEARGVV